MYFYFANSMITLNINKNPLETDLRNQRDDFKLGFVRGLNHAGFSEAIAINEKMTCSRGSWCKHGLTELFKETMSTI